MAWQPPAIDTISKRVRARFRAEMPGTEPAIWPNNLYIVTKVFAAILQGQYQELATLRRQRHAHMAEGEGLDEAGLDFGITRAAATFAAGMIRVTSTPGTDIPDASQFVRADGVVFATDDPVTTAAAVSDVPAHAVEAGVTGNTSSGAALPPLMPIPGVTAAEAGPLGIGGGVDLENDASLRARILDRKRNPPLGGSPSEYITWTREYPGVSRVWVLRATPGPGQVTIVFMMDGSYADGIPLAGDVTAVQAIINSRAPSDAEALVKAPVAQAINVTINDLQPSTLAVKNDVEAELAAAIRRRGQPGTFEAPFLFSRSWLEEAISVATDEDRHVLTTPAADILFQAASAGLPPKLATLGTVTYT